MLQIRPLPTPVAMALLVLSGCTDRAPRLLTPAAPIDVIEAAPVAPITVEPLPALPIVPEPVYLVPMPLPARHQVTTAALPAGATTLDLVQSVEVEVEVVGGEVGSREIAAVFVTPQGLVWQRQASRTTMGAEGALIAHFSLPVAATFIEDQQLFGRWQVLTLDDGVEQASASFELRAQP